MKLRPKHELPVIPTANLVDIAILLVIFYMACSNFVSQQALRLKLPKSADIDKMNEPLVLVSIDGEGVIRLQGRPVAGAEDVQSGVADLIRGKQSDDARRVMFRCDSTVDRHVFEPVLNAIVEAGGTIVAVGEKEKTRGG